MTSSERKTLFITYLCASMKNIGPENTMRQVTHVTKTQKNSKRRNPKSFQNSQQKITENIWRLHEMNTT